MAAVELVPVREDEAGALLTMARRYWQGLMPLWRGNYDEAYQVAYFAERFAIGQAEAVYWWAVVAGTRIGFAYVRLHADLDGPWAQVHDFFVEAEHRRRGHGRAFAAAIRAELEQRGCRRVDLTVRTDNPGALAFWRGVGFELTSYRMRAYL